MKLETGDLIFTGTPKGVSKVASGDKLEAALDGIVKLESSVK
jgi:2-keto-4-pentenoate hydratase/2-oxohepta-3-ene-1,7-dioic acid hydratase in catechol pathway